MAVSPEYQAYVLEQLERVAPVRARRMFGGVGLYSEDLFFALLDDDRLYFKVDDTNRPDYEALGQQPFDPFKDGVRLMQYYEVPADLIEDPDDLRPWLDKALAVARGKSAGKGPKRGKPRQAGTRETRGPS
jgi:DNA transformation protein and related proteins